MAEAPERGAALAKPRPVLAAGTEFRGVVALPGPASIDGTVRGEVVTGGPLWVGETGLIEADLEAESVVVAGRVIGDVRARVRIELRPTAAVQGGLEAPSVVFAEGSVVDGWCRTGAASDAPDRSS
jgi:cytoskeletal protein CcmA (bactofilin family)